MAATGGTPRPVIRKLHDALISALNAPDMQSRPGPLGAEPVGSAPGASRPSVRRQVRLIIGSSVSSSGSRAMPSHVSA
jgi:hypothetical protein